MTQADNFLHTTHRTITWFKKAFTNDELVLTPPFQRGTVWTNLQKAYLLDTVLNGLPIPEIYMQDIGNENGEEKHIVVDGQQRIRAVLDYVTGQFSLDGEDVTKRWRNARFDELDPEDKKKVFNYKFVVRILPPNLKEEEIRGIFARINKNVVSLTDQELRNATYWGPFIKSIQSIADQDPFWATSGIFSANDMRRMNDHEYISELAIAYLHGPQNKKDKLDYFYLLYEEQFESQYEMISDFKKVTSEINRMFPTLFGTRWRKKSDFYTLFLALAERRQCLPFDNDRVIEIKNNLVAFSAQVEELLKLEEKDWTQQNQHVVNYARNVARAASDRTNRIARSDALSRFVFQDIIALDESLELQLTLPGADPHSLDWDADETEIGH